jgi:hypothetical protein
LVGIVNKNLLYIDATDNIQVSGAIIDDFDQSLTRKGEEDKKNIQLLKAALKYFHILRVNIWGHVVP